MPCSTTRASRAWPDLVEAAREADVVLFGEYHDDPVMHWLQVELVRDLLAADVRPALGAEMLEADDQLVVDEFLAGWVSDDKLKAAANLWPNHFTDYHPLLELAKDNELPFIATNVPRRYASYVYQHGLTGLEELSEDAKAFLPPLPVPFDITLPGYDAMLAMGGGHGGETLPMAQAIKDATMAHFIFQTCPKGAAFVHFNGLSTTAKMARASDGHLARTSPTLTFSRFTSTCNPTCRRPTKARWAEETSF